MRDKRLSMPTKKSNVCKIVCRILFPILIGGSSGSNAMKLCLSSLPLWVVGVEAAAASLREPWVFAAQARD